MGETNSLGALAVSAGKRHCGGQAGFRMRLRLGGGGRCGSMWGVCGLQVRGICSQKLVYKEVFGIHL